MRKLSDSKEREACSKSNQRWVTTFFEANINGAEAFYELKMKFEMQNVSFWGKVVNHARREMLVISDDLKFPSQLLASTMHQLHRRYEIYS